jgi:hypothetical protein
VVTPVADDGLHHLVPEARAAALLSNAERLGLVVTFVPKVPFWKLRNFNALRPTCATTH